MRKLGVPIHRGAFLLKLGYGRGRIIHHHQSAHHSFCDLLLRRGGQQRSFLANSQRHRQTGSLRVGVPCALATSSALPVVVKFALSGVSRTDLSVGTKAVIPVLKTELRLKIHPRQRERINRTDARCFSFFVPT